MSRGAIASPPRTTTAPRKASSSRRARSGSVAAGPVSSPRRNHRGPSMPTKRIGCGGAPGRGGASGVPTGHAGAQLGAERPLGVVGDSAAAPDGLRDLGPDLRPDAGRPGRGERVHLHRARPVDQRHGDDRLVLQVHPDLDAVRHRHLQRSEVEARQPVVGRVRCVPRAGRRRRCRGGGGGAAARPAGGGLTGPALVGRPSSGRPSSGRAVAVWSSSPCRRRRNTSAPRVATDSTVATGGAEATLGAGGVGQLVDHSELGGLHPLHHELGDPVAP